MTTGLATSVTRMTLWARSSCDFARGRCEAEDVDSSARHCDSRDSQSPGVVGVRRQTPPGYGRRPRSATVRHVGGRGRGKRVRPSGVTRGRQRGGSPHTNFSFCVQRCSDMDYNDNFDWSDARVCCVCRPRPPIIIIDPRRDSLVTDAFDRTR